MVRSPFDMRTVGFFPSLLVITCYWLMTSPGSSAHSPVEEKQNGTENSSTPHCMKPSKIRVNTTDQLRRLRLVMKEQGLVGYIVPAEDAHQSEYVPDYTKRRQYISGFTGSAGVAVVLEERAVLFTDSRYRIQAPLEMDCHWELAAEDANVFGSVTSIPSLVSPADLAVAGGAKIGVDSRLVTTYWHQWAKTQLSRYNITLVAKPSNLVDRIWTIGGGRPAEPLSTVVVHDLKYAGETWQSKVKRLRQELAKKKVDGIIISALNEIAWLFNLRGNDVHYTPVFESFAAVTDTEVKLYVERKGRILSTPVREHLNADCANGTEECVTVMHYDDAYKDVPATAARLSRTLITASCNYALCGSIDEEKQVTEASPIIYFQAIKNSVEAEGMRSAHLKDAVAQASCYAQLEKDLEQGKTWDELKVGERLIHFRKEQKLYREDSFETIALSGPNSALPHFVPSPLTVRPVDKDHMLLVDTGAQYLDGTVDITRTWHFGKPTLFQKEAYTRVLMGVIDVFTFTFPEGVTDAQVDVLARRPLFDAGLTYGHGTGHGIGSYLGVHESIPALTRKANPHGTALAPGMFFSVEPGFYLEGEFGVRLETTATILEMTPKYNLSKLKFYKLEPVAFVPFDQNLILPELLSIEQVKWLNTYNENVLLHVGKELTKQKRYDASDWLRRKVFILPVPRYSSSSATMPSAAWTTAYFLFMTAFLYSVIRANSS